MFFLQFLLSVAPFDVGTGCIWNNDITSLSIVGDAVPGEESINGMLTLGFVTSDT